MTEKHARNPFQRLWQAWRENRLPHAVMLAGSKGAGKSAFAKRLTIALLCHNQTATGDSCGDCHSCRQVAQNVHPDVLWIEPEKAGQAIKIDQIRSLVEFVSQTSLQGGLRIAILHPADALNINAANALLKTLEEPAPGALMILINDLSGRIPATVASRCQRIQFPQPSRQAMLEGQLVQAEREKLFTQLSALTSGNLTPVDFAAGYAKDDMVPLLDTMLSFVVDVIKLQAGGNRADLLNADQVDLISTVKTKTTLQASRVVMERLGHLRALFSQGVNLNRQLVLEDTLSSWGR